jgi:hypothetical protein
MDLYYTIVLTIAIMLLIVVLAIIGVSMTRKSVMPYPPSSQQCPDYWSLANDGVSCMIPSKGSKNAGAIYDSAGKILINQNNTPGLSSDSKSVKFDNTLWASGGTTAQCSEKTWANKFNVMWDGISNFNKC